MLLRLEDVAREIGARTLFSGVDLEVRAGDRVGIIGANGSGKTTLLRIAARLEEPDAGSVRTPERVRVGLLRQELDPRSPRTVREEVAAAFLELERIAAEMRELEVAMARAGGADPDPARARRYDALRARFELAGGFSREARVDRILAGLGLDGALAETPLHRLSGGFRMRVELARLLADPPEVLLLDEPTNHLDLPSVEWFESFLEGYPGALVVVTHDRTFLARHATRIAELAGGSLVVFDGPLSRYEEVRARRLEEARRAREREARQRAREERFIERFRAKASKARQVRSRIRALERRAAALPELPPETPRRRPVIRIPEPPRSGDLVLRLSGVEKHFEGRAVLRGVDLELARGDRVALVGRNGAGKSTLLRILAGTLVPDRGEVRRGHGVEIASYAQHTLLDLDPSRTVFEELARVARGEEHARIRDHLGAFLFPADAVERRVSVLSGGEKARLALARLLFRPANLMLLDEPTNHLDLDARDVLREALAGTRGTLVLVSHDRSLLEAVATRILELRDGELHEIRGGVAELLARLRREREAPPGPKPPGSATATPATTRRQRQKELQRRRAVLHREVEALETAIGEAEARRAEIDRALGAPEIWRSGTDSRALATERRRVEAALSGQLARWEAALAELDAVEAALAALRATSGA